MRCESRTHRTLKRDRVKKRPSCFQKIGVDSIEDLLEYYPRAYDTYEEPAFIAQIKPDTVMTVAGMLERTPDVKRYSPYSGYYRQFKRHNRNAAVNLV